MIDKFETISKEHTIGVSSITVAELYYGVRKRGSQKLEVLVNEFLLPLERYPFDDKAAFVYGNIRTDLESKGNTIGPNDLFIAAHAKSLDAVLITNNIKEFQRVENLSLENWVD